MNAPVGKNPLSDKGNKSDIYSAYSQLGTFGPTTSQDLYFPRQHLHQYFSNGVCELNTFCSVEQLFSFMIFLIT